MPSQGSSSPLPSTIFMSTPKMARPCLRRIFICSASGSVRCLFFSVHSVPSGDISVMPQACSTSTPYSSRKAVIMAGGQAEPPITVRFSVENLRLLGFMWPSSICQMVGTPAA